MANKTSGKKKTGRSAKSASTSSKSRARVKPVGTNKDQGYRFGRLKKIGIANLGVYASSG